jgi:LCP family protein required for cell wall assembly
MSRLLPPGRWGVATAILYSLVTLIVAGSVSFWLYDWARLRILNSSSFSDLANWHALIPGNFARPAGEAGDPNAAGAVQGKTALEDAGGQAAAPVPAINVLLLGTDARPDDSDAPRTDTMILLTIDPQGQSVGMLSLPRDLWVPIPDLGYDSKINTAYSLGESYGYEGGGAQLAKNTVSSFIGQPVQYYALVNFEGFVELIDLIGGVDVVVPTTIHDEQYPTVDYGVTTFHLEAGAQHLDGATALRYVRTRNLDDDYARSIRQQEVIRAVLDKVLRADMLPTLLTKLPRLLYTMRNSIKTDIPPSLQFEFATFLRGSSPREIRQLVLDNRFGIETYAENGAWILVPDRMLVRAALADFFAPPTGGNASVAFASSEWVRIEVLNGTGEPGVAAATADLLQSQGWQVVSIGDADRSDYGRTIIINYGVPDELVTQVGTDLALEPNLSSLHGLNVSAPVDVRIVVGRDFLTHLR